MNIIEDEIDYLSSLIKNIAQQFGDNCEVVLHKKYPDGKMKIFQIENGHVSGRKVGECSSNLFFEEYIEKDFKRNPVYFSELAKGKLTLSSTTVIENNNKDVIGSICINFDISDLIIAKNAIEKLLGSNIQEEPEKQFPHDISEVLDYYIAESEEIVGKPAALMTKEEKFKAIEYLDKKKAFLITKSSLKVCEHFNISKYALYTYLEEIRSQA